MHYTLLAKKYYQNVKQFIGLMKKKIIFLNILNVQQYLKEMSGITKFTKFNNNQIGYIDQNYPVLLQIF